MGKTVRVALGGGKEPITVDGVLVGTRLAVTPWVNDLIARRRWTITHLKTGRSLESLLPEGGRRAKDIVLRQAKAIATINHPAWAMMDALKHGGTWGDLSGRDVDTLREFASIARAKAREAAGGALMLATLTRLLAFLAWALPVGVLLAIPSH
jgi:hypothetical protein